MKFLSVKLKLTILMTSIMTFLVAFMLIIMLLLSGRIITKSNYELLSNTVRQNLSSISKENGKLVFSDSFSFYYNGVYTTIYNADGALLAGQLPLNFPTNTKFNNGAIQEINTRDGEYDVIDFWLHFGWEDGVWVRGVIQKPDIPDIVDDMTIIVLVLCPLTIILGAIGAYMLAKATFKPIDKIIHATSAIAQGSDLSLRIALPKGNDEITKLAQAFDNMFERLETSFESEKQFTSDASHELRTPTTVILAQCRDAKQHYTSIEQYEDAMNVIERQASKMSALISQLLQMTRIEQGTQVASFEMQNISELVNIICSEQPDMPENMKMYVDVQENIIAEFDVVLISRLLQNLINNAIRYGKQNGYIKVRLYKQLKTIYLEVEDNGIGIPQDKIENIWKRFYQVDASRTNQNGTGLGLTMVRQIANMHNGNISVKSIFGEGSCFIFTFPEKQSK